MDPPEPPPPPVPVDGECLFAEVGGGNSLVFSDPDNNDDNWNIRRNGKWIDKVIGNNNYVDTEGVTGDTYQVRYWIPGEGRQDIDCVEEGGPTPPPATPCTLAVVGGGVRVTWEAVAGEDRYSVRRNGDWVKTVTNGLTWVDPDGTAADSYEVRATVAGVRTIQDCD